MSGGRRKMQDPQAPGRVLDRLIGVIEKISDDSARQAEEAEFFADRLAAIERRLTALDNLPDPLTTAHRAQLEMVGRRKRKGRSSESIGVTPSGRLEFPVKVPS